MDEKLKLIAHPVMTFDKTHWRPAVIVEVDGVKQRHVVNEQRLRKKKDAIKMSNEMAETMIMQMRNEILQAMNVYARKNSNTR